jgi:2-methylcitrate dehydratase PrpD
LGLNARQFGNAISLAATGAAGHRAHFGTDTKSAHAGYAAYRGLHAALLAERGFTAAADGICGRRGLLEVVGPDGPHEGLAMSLGDHWHLLDNRIKPYASGVVTHPVIDVARLVRDRLRGDVAQLATAELRVQPLVGELTGIVDPRTGLEGKFSVTHCFAAGLLRGSGGPQEFTDAFVRSPAARAVRGRTTVVVESTRAHLTAEVRFARSDGHTEVIDVIDSRGSESRPLTIDEVESKFAGLVRGRLGSRDARTWFRRFVGLEAEPSLRQILRDFDVALGPVVARSRP